MKARQRIGTYRDSVHEVVLGRAGPYGFVVSLVVVTLGLYRLRGAPRPADVLGLILGGAAGVAAAGTLGLRRRARVSSEEALPERWLDFHPLAVALSAAAGIAAGSGSMRDAAAWVVGAAVAGLVYVLVAAVEVGYRRRRAQRITQRVRAATRAPVELGRDIPVNEWLRARRESIEALVQLEAPVAQATREGRPSPTSVAVAESPAASPHPASEPPRPPPAPNRNPPPDEPPQAASPLIGPAPPVATQPTIVPEAAAERPAEVAEASPAEPLAAHPAASAPPSPAQPDLPAGLASADAPRTAPAAARPSSPAPAPSLRTLLIMTSVAVIGLVLIVRLLHH